MYIAMNRFKVIKGHEEEFERRWLGRDTYLDQLPGFVEFNLLRGPDRDDHTLYSSIRCGRTRTPSRTGRVRSSFAPPTATPGTTSHCTSVIRNSRASRRSRR